MSAPTCPICLLPAHAAETDDLDRHPECVARLVAAATEVVDLLIRVSEHFEHTDAPLGVRARELLTDLSGFNDPPCALCQGYEHGALGCPHEGQP